VENPGDVSLREAVHPGADEYRLRRFFAGELRRRSRDRYKVPEEEEIDLKQRPDLRVEKPGLPPLSIEIKWADKWSLAELCERLENQLVGRYLRARGNRYGIYLLGNIGNKQHWPHPTTGQRLTFNEAVEFIRAKAKTLVEANPGVGAIEVISVDFARPCPAASQ
jgi:hypothetical protein